MQTIIDDISAGYRATGPNPAHRRRSGIIGDGVAALAILSNRIVVQKAVARGVDIRYREHFRVGAPVTRPLAAAWPSP